MRTAAVSGRRDQVNPGTDDRDSSRKTSPLTPALSPTGRGSRAVHLLDSAGHHEVRIGRAGTSPSPGWPPTGRGSRAVHPLDSRGSSAGAGAAAVALPLTATRKKCLGTAPPARRAAGRGSFTPSGREPFPDDHHEPRAGRGGENTRPLFIRLEVPADLVNTALGLSEASPGRSEASQPVLLLLGVERALRLRMNPH